MATVKPIKPEKPVDRGWLDWTPNPTDQQRVRRWHLVTVHNVNPTEALMPQARASQPCDLCQPSSAGGRPHRRQARLTEVRGQVIDMREWLEKRLRRQLEGLKA